MGGVFQRTPKEDRRKRIAGRGSPKQIAESRIAENRLLKTDLDYPGHSAANHQKTLAPSGIRAIESSIPILRVHAEPAG
jgi:hypothetical protein